MHRFYLAPSDCNTDRLLLSERDAHHAATVLRIKRGERVIVLNGAGSELQCSVEECSRKQVQLRVVERKNIPSLPFHITLLQAIPKGKIIESIVQKATELGAARVVPLLSERVATRLDEDNAGQKGEKWQQVAIEAVKQCGAAWLPKVEAPTTPKDFLARGEGFDLPLVASLHPGARHPRHFFREYDLQHHRKPESACVWIGPEGDFTRDEIEAITVGGAKPITLGRLVLRVETAASFCLSILNYELLAPRD